MGDCSVVLPLYIFFPIEVKVEERENYIIFPFVSLIYSSR